MGLVVVGVAFATLSVLSGLAAFATVGDRSDRTAARAFLIASDAVRPDAWMMDLRKPYGNAMLRRVDIALSEHPPPPPPGLDRWPQPNEQFVSPAYLSAVEDDTRLRSYAPGEVIGTIASAGLRSPDELVVYRGVERSELPRGGVNVITRHAEPVTALSLDTVELSGGQVIGLMAVFGVLVGLPIVAFLAVASRLSSSTRARRLATLHLLGVSSASVRAVNTVEVAVLALLGAAVALATYPALNAGLAASGVLGIVWFASDTALSFTSAAGVLTAVTLIAAYAARRVNRGAHLTSVHLRRPEKAPTTSTSLWRLTPFAVGVISLSAQVLAGSTREQGQAPYVHLELLMLFAVLVTGTGLLLVISPVTRVLGHWMHRHGSTLSARLGGARAAFDPAGAARLVAGLAVLVFATGVAIGQTRDARAVSYPATEFVDISVDAAELPTGAAASLLTTSPAPGLLQVAALPTEGSSTLTTAVVASCDQFARFLGDRAFGGVAADGKECRSGTAYWALNRPVEQRSLDDLPLAPQSQGRLSVASMTQAVSDELDVDVLITDPAAADLTTAPGSEGANEYENSKQLVFRVPREAVDSQLARIYAAAPYSKPSALGLDPDSGEKIAMINGYIRLGLFTGILMSLLALTTALADRATEKRRADHELLAAGAPSSLVRRAHRWEVALTVSAALALASASGILGGYAWQLAGGLDTTLDWTAITTLLLCSVAAGAFAVVVAAATAPRQLDPAELRGE